MWSIDRSTDQNHKEWTIQPMPKVAEVPTPEISLSKGPNETDVDNDVADKLSQNSQSLERALERVMDDELQN